jgi:hypothetical protein
MSGEDQLGDDTVDLSEVNLSQDVEWDGNSCTKEQH